MGVDLTGDILAKRVARTRRESKPQDAPEIEIDPDDRPASAKPRAAPRSAAKARGEAKPAGRKRGKKRVQRSTLFRVAYWGAVAALWLVIAGIGTIVWVGAICHRYNLSTFQSGHRQSRSSISMASRWRRAATSGAPPSR